MDNLTDKQGEVLNFIREYQLAYGKSPTVKEMRENFQLASDNSIIKHIKALEEKGYIMKDDTPRGIQMLTSVREVFETGSETSSLPLLGTIPAGGPSHSEEYVLDRINIDKQFVKYPQDTFMLRVTGESMIDAGIYEGDLVIASNKIKPQINDIVIALIDGENTIKRLVKGPDGRAYLKAENQNYSDLYPVSELIVQGVVSGLVRTYK